jgi:anaerobic dimethyl sulfoxide reductase subunit B (iron-sulfur subunit)
MQWVFYFDQSRCIGCNTCVVACKDWNAVNPGPANWRRLTVKEEGVFPNVSVFNLVISCYHCKNPACVRACASGAISKRSEDGIVVVDRSKCKGLKDCLYFCPFGAPQFADDQSEPQKEDDWKVKHPMQKCHFCLDNLKTNKKPACVDSCIVRALDAGPEAEIRRKYPGAVNVVVGFPDSSQKPSGEKLHWGDTKPSVYFKPKSARIPWVDKL